MSGWSLFGLLIGLELTGLDLKTADAAYPRFYRAIADFVYHGRLGLRSRKAWRSKLLPLTAADLRQDLCQLHRAFRTHRVRRNIAWLAGARESLRREPARF
jgi:hypothetical protein